LLLQDHAQREMERKGMLTVCNKGMKSGGKRKNKRQAVLKKRGKTVKDRREIEKLTLEDEKLFNAVESSAQNLHPTSCGISTQGCRRHPSRKEFRQAQHT
jgi:hypothetical protein